MPSERAQKELQKLIALRLNARNVMAQVDAGGYIDLDIEEIDGFLDKIANRVKANQAQRFLDSNSCHRSYNV